jgi:hypothetical protein
MRPTSTTYLCTTISNEIIVEEVEVDEEGGRSVICGGRISSFDLSSCHCSTSSCDRLVGERMVEWILLKAEEIAEKASKLCSLIEKSRESLVRSEERVEILLLRVI